MKYLVLILAVFLLSGCRDNTATTDNEFHAVLPPETQTGANTFGVTINGKAYVPRDPTGVSVGTTAKGMILWGASDFSWYEIEIKDGASPVGFQMIIHMEPLLSIGQILLKKSNFHDQIDSIRFSHIYFKIWDSNIGNYAYYGSIEDQGNINITRLDSGIISGNFTGKFVRYDNPNDFIKITDGRFDINALTLQNHPFP